MTALQIRSMKEVDNAFASRIRNEILGSEDRLTVAVHVTLGHCVYRIEWGRDGASVRRNDHVDWLERIRNLFSHRLIFGHSRARQIQDRINRHWGDDELKSAFALAESHVPRDILQVVSHYLEGWDALNFGLACKATASLMEPRRSFEKRRLAILHLSTAFGLFWRGLGSAVGAPESERAALFHALVDRMIVPAQDKVSRWLIKDSERFLVWSVFNCIAKLPEPDDQIALASRLAVGLLRLCGKPDPWLIVSDPPPFEGGMRCFAPAIRDEIYELVLADLLFAGNRNVERFVPPTVTVDGPVVALIPTIDDEVKLPLLFRHAFVAIGRMLDIRDLSQLARSDRLICRLLGPVLEHRRIAADENDRPRIDELQAHFSALQTEWNSLRIAAQLNAILYCISLLSSWNRADQLSKLTETLDSTFTMVGGEERKTAAYAWFGENPLSANAVHAIYRSISELPDARQPAVARALTLFFARTKSKQFRIVGVACLRDLFRHIALLVPAGRESAAEAIENFLGGSRRRPAGVDSFISDLRTVVGGTVVSSRGVRPDARPQARDVRASDAQSPAALHAA